MLDFGLTEYGDMEDYNTKFLNELSPGNEICGEIVVGEFKKVPMGKREVAEFYVIITNRENRTKWVSEFTTPYYPETDNIYGENGGLFYTFIDSLNHVVNKTPLNWQDNYSVNFSQFRKTVNESLSSIKVKAVPPVNPDAKTVNLQVTDAVVKTESEKDKPLTIYDLAQKDPIILMAYANLRNKGDRITVKNITFELRSSLDDGVITKNAFQNALVELNQLEPSVDHQ
ncbi:hypothetical protein BK008_11435 [Methanobacterium sp. MZ-A1]|uniref:hypothetical protein n=1 Tax=Methanobacterium sp. MZ-A1 TaxID=1911685 RepID=UPI000C2D4848|nr:hypothetical protein [Methanobacterium sp. MZ-A1]AUB58862.1 hypothetical protein BK008_11435 [Methanobacterium sp. MZ-A1]MBW4257550.1 hypothetical protein [Methanobacterium sp. YSL]